MVVPLPHLFIYLSPLELPDLFISSINYLTISSTSLSLSLSLSPLELPNLFISSINYLTFSSTSLSLSPLELPDLFISPINYTPNFLFKSYARIFFSLPVVPIVLLLFESQRYILSTLVSDWLCQVSCFYLFFYLVFLFCSIFLFFGFWCSLFRWFYNFVVPKFFSSNVLIVVLTSFVFLFILMLSNIVLLIIFIFGLWCSLLRWFYNFLVPKLFSSNVLIVVLTSFVFLFILMLYNIRLIILDIFPVHRTGLRLVS